MILHYYIILIYCYYTLYEYIPHYIINIWIIIYIYIYTQLWTNKILSKTVTLIRRNVNFLIRLLNIFHAHLFYFEQKAISYLAFLISIYSLFTIVCSSLSVGKNKPKAERVIFFLFRVNFDFIMTILTYYLGIFLKHACFKDWNQYNNVFGKIISYALIWIIRSNSNINKYRYALYLFRQNTK